MRHILGNDDQRDQITCFRAVDVATGIGAEPHAHIEIEVMRFAVAEGQLNSVLVDEFYVMTKQCPQHFAAPMIGRHHEALADDNLIGRDVFKKLAKIILANVAVRQRRVATPGEAHCGDDLGPVITVDLGDEQAALAVFRFDQHPRGMIGGTAIAVHFLDVNFITQAIGQVFLRVGLRLEDPAWLGHGHYSLPYIRAIRPPSISRLCPVMYVAASEARKTAAPTTSSGCPQRAIGMRSAT